MLYFMGLALALGLGVPIAAFGAALGQGKAAAAALEGIARQPAEGNNIRTSMILAFAFIESLVIFSFVVFILLYLKVPDTAAIVDAVKSSATAGK